MAIRRFKFTLTISDSHGPVNEIRGETDVHDDNRSYNQICQKIIDDLPSQARPRQGNYSYSVGLQQI